MIVAICWRRCARAFIAMVFGIFCLEAMAQTYAYRNDVFSYDTPSASAKTVTWHTTTSAACSGYPNGDDDYADITFAGATSPANDFVFTFAGVARTGVRIYSNGMLAFGNDTSGFWRDYTNSTLPVTTAVPSYSASCPGGIPANTIVAYWTDIVAGTANSTTGASVQYELLGTAPNRRFVISWVNVKLYNQTARYNFQVILYESPAGGLNSNFKYQYTTGSSTGSAATVGVQVSSTDYTLYAFNQAFIDPIAGSAILWYPANQLQGKQAEYRFDEGSWNGTSGEVKDTSTGAYNAASVGSAVNVANGKVCRGASIPFNTSNTVIDAVATPVAPASAGSIDFWYNANAKWNVSGSDATLFDATATAARPFFLSKTASGTLKFSVTDSGGTVLTLSSAAQSFSAGTWHHVGVSWNLRPGTNQTVLQIFLDGALATSLRTTSTGSIAALSTLNIGDNRTSGVTPSGGTPNSANGLIDEANFYSIEINASQANADKNASRSSCLAFDHFHIVHDGSMVNCGSATANITIEAHDSAHSLISLAGTTVSLSTSTAHGDWTTVAGGSINSVVNSGNGAGSYTFSNESRVILGLQDTYNETLNINVTAGVYSEHSGVAATCTGADYTFGSVCDADLSFDSAGFRFVDASGNPIGNQVAAVTSGTYYLQAVKSSCTTPGSCTGVCTALFSPTTPVNVDLAFECVNPSACQAAQNVTFTPGAGAGTAGTIAANGNGAVSPSTGSYTTSSLTFNAATVSGAVPFTFAYPDVGKLTLRARYPAGSTSPSVSGQSAAFVVAPHHLALSGIPAAPLVAGKGYSAAVTVYNASGNPTPNFGQETTPATVSLASSLCKPAGGAAGTLSYTVGAFSSGAASITGLAWSEVGIIDLTATTGDYLASGLSATGNTGTSGVVCNGGNGNVGRFIPEHLETTVTQACVNAAAPLTSFTYSGQSFKLKIAAYRVGGSGGTGITTNYDGSLGFSKIVTVSGVGAAGVITGGDVSGHPDQFNASDFTSGTTPLLSSGSVLRPVFTFSAVPGLPSTVSIRATDADGVTSNGFTEATLAVRSGRLWLSNAYGNEFLPLPVPVQTQFWTSTGWTKNTWDNCTSLTTPTSASGLSNTLSSKTTASLSSPVVSGDAGFRLSAPGAGNTGVVDIDASVVRGGNSWLGLSAPNARACFGRCGPRSPVIYSRELY